MRCSSFFWKKANDQQQLTTVTSFVASQSVHCLLAPAFFHQPAHIFSRGHYQRSGAAMVSLMIRTLRARTARLHFGAISCCCCCCTVVMRLQANIVSSSFFNLHVEEKAPHFFIKKTLTAAAAAYMTAKCAHLLSVMLNTSTHQH